MDNQILSANINVRTTLEVKKKLMDESDKRDMKMSEYVLFILETHWNKLDVPPSQENGETMRLREELTEVKKKLSEAQAVVVELTDQNNQLIERLREQPKTVWQEAAETTHKLSEEHIQQRVDIAISKYNQQMNEQLMLNENLKINNLVARIQLYETPLLKTIFQIISKSNYNIKDLPDIVAILTQHYYQEVIIPNQYHLYEDVK